MSKPTKLVKKKITLERISPRLIASTEKMPPIEKNPKKLTSEKKRKALEEGLKRKHEENEVKESKKAKKKIPRREKCGC